MNKKLYQVPLSPEVIKYLRENLNVMPDRHEELYAFLTPTEKLNHLNFLASQNALSDKEWIEILSKVIKK